MVTTTTKPVPPGAKTTRAKQSVSLPPQPRGYARFVRKPPSVFAHQVKETAFYRIGSPASGYRKKRVRAGMWIVRDPIRHDMECGFGGEVMTDAGFRDRYATPEAWPEISAD